jgi:hypothetical protein
MIQLMDRLLRRWIGSIDEFGTIDRYKTQVKTYRYAGAPRFDLSRFENGQFSDKKAWTAGEEAPDWRETYTFGLNEQGLPCYLTAHHNYNKTDWAGFYSYSEQLVEHLEFSLATGIPSRLQRIEYQDGKKMLDFSLSVNGGGSYFRDQSLSKEERARQMINNPNDLILSLDSYQFDEHGKVIRADGIRRLPGLPQYTTSDEYTYDAADTLITIRRFFDHGTDRLIYSRIPEGTSAERIVDKLAAALSVAVVDALVADRQKEAARSGTPEITKEPIGLVTLGYSYAESYYPLAGYQLARTIKQDLEEGVFNFCSFVRSADNIETRHLQDLYAQLGQLMNEENDPSLGQDMLRKTAAFLVRTWLHGRLPVSDDFGALALDGHIEGHSDEQMEEILLACGNDAAVLSLWKQKGML